MGAKFKASIELSKFEAPSSPKDGELKLYAGVDDKLGIVLTDDTIRKILDDGDLPLSVANGGTGSTTIGDARESLGLGDVATEDVLPTSKGGTGLTEIGTAGQVLSVNEDGSGLEWMEASSGKRYVYTFTENTWDNNLQIVVQPEAHKLGEQGDLLVAVRDSYGNQVTCGINVTPKGVVTISTNDRFDGVFMIYGAASMIGPDTGGAGDMVNPMLARGDVIVGAESGTPDRLAIGTAGQVLSVNSSASGLEWATISSGGGEDTGGHTIQHDGESFPTRNNLNFIGALQVTDSDSSTDISIDTNQFLKSGNNLSEIENKSEALQNLGGISSDATVNDKLLTSNPVLSTDDIAEGEANKYNVQSDWLATSGAAKILNKPELADVAVSGQYSDLAGCPTIGTLGQQSASNVSITGGKITGITDLAVADGGTGASTASGARTNLGLGSVAVENVVPITKGGTGLSGIGSAGQVLSVNSSANGLVWTTISSDGGGSEMTNPMTELGDTIAGGANGVPVRVPVPTTGLKWYMLQCYFNNGLPNVRWNSACAVQSWWADNKNNFYRKYADGWIMQGGMIDAGVKEVTLYITMVYDDYFVACNTIGAATDTTVQESQICPISTRYNKFTFSATTTAKRRWFVCGF